MRRPFALALILLITSSLPLAADDTPIDAETLRESIRFGSPEESIYATAALFREALDTELEAILTDASLSRERRLRVIRALEIHGRERPVAACAILRPLLNQDDESLRAAATAAIIANEPLLPPRAGGAIDGSSYAWLRDALLEALARPSLSPAERREAARLIDILAEKQDPVFATQALIAVYEVAAGRLRERIDAALETVTGVRDVEDWPAWFEAERRRPRSAWLRRRIDRMEADNAALRAELEQASVDIFSKLTKALASDDRALFGELQSAAYASPVTAIRLEALRQLGELAHSRPALAEECVQSLQTLLDQPALSPELNLAALRALGETRQQSAAEPLMARLHSGDRDQLVVVVSALSRLRHTRAIDPLKEVILRQLESPEPDAELMLKAIQGLEQIGLDPEARISTALIAVIDATRRERAGLTDDDRKALLQAAAAALGRLDYDLETSARAASKALESILDSPFPEVRFFVADSLSRLKFVDVREPLATLLRDAELSVRQAAVRGLGRRGLQPGLPKERRRDIIQRLIDILLGPDETVHATTRAGLSNLVKDDFKKTLGNLTLITEAFDTRARIDLALPFLELLERDPALSPERALRYDWLLEARVRAALEATRDAPPPRQKTLLDGALADVRLLLESPRAKSKARYRQLEARIHLDRGEPREACRILAKDLADPEAFSLWRRGMTALRDSQRPRLLREQLELAERAGLSEESTAVLAEFSAWLDANPEPEAPRERKEGGTP